MATILPHAARQVRRLERDILAELARWGYEEIILPTLEYLDVLAPGLEAELVEKSYKLADRTTGRMLLLRPDATAQIARTVGMVAETAKSSACSLNACVPSASTPLLCP